MRRRGRRRGWMSRHAGSSMLICPDTPPGDCLAVAPRQQAFNLHEFIPNLCPAGLVLAWPSPHFYLPPSPLILGWAVRTARSLKGVELSALPTSGHLCDERPVSRPASYKVGIPPSPITGRAEGSRFVLGSILLYRVNVERATAHLPRLRVFPQVSRTRTTRRTLSTSNAPPCAFATLRPRSPPPLPLSLGI